MNEHTTCILIGDCINIVHGKFTCICYWNHYLCNYEYYSNIELYTCKCYYNYILPTMSSFKHGIIAPPGDYCLMSAYPANTRPRSCCVIFWQTSATKAQYLNQHQCHMLFGRVWSRSRHDALTLWWPTV